MDGAYTALPGADTAPDVPDGWDIDWPSPGPLPPGYESELTFGLEAQEVMVPGISVSDVTLTLLDHEEYGTTEPTEQITWSATLKSTNEVINLKFSGGDNFFSEITQAYGSIGDDFWGAEPIFEFEVSDDNIGDAIVLKSSSDPFNFSLEKTSEILIIASTLSAVFKVEIVVSGTSIHNDPFRFRYEFGADLYIHGEGGINTVPWCSLTGDQSLVWHEPGGGVWIPYMEPYGEEWGAWLIANFDKILVYLDRYRVEVFETTNEGYIPPTTTGGWIYESNSSPETNFSVYTLQPAESPYWTNALSITAILAADIIYEVENLSGGFITTGEEGIVTLDYTLKVYENGVLQDTKTKQVIKAANAPAGLITTWCTIDGATGVITEL